MEKWGRRKGEKGEEKKVLRKGMSDTREDG